MRKDYLIYSSIGVCLFVLFSFALYSSGKFWYGYFTTSPVVMGQTIDLNRSINSVEGEESFTGGNYRVMRGVSKGELNQSIGSRFYLAWPVKDNLGVVTQCYSKDHQAIDIAHYTYPKILAVADGVVIKAGCLEEDCPEENLDEDGLGLARTVLIQHENGLISLYGHLKSISVDEGESVTRGDEIGEMGKSGSTVSISESGEGVHLHFALLLNEDWVTINPAPYFREEFCTEGLPDPEAYWDPVDDGIYDDFDFEGTFSNEIEPLADPQLLPDESEGGQSESQGDSLEGIIRIDNDDDPEEPVVEEEDDSQVDPTPE